MIWTEDEVENLKERQKSHHMHPYTCVCGEDLIPTSEGWICNKCDYTQDWAHGADVSGEFKKLFPEMM